jgi:hypothetical protein
MLDILRTLDVLLERHTCIYAVGTKELGNRDRKRSITLKSTETITLKPPRKSNKNLRILLYVILNLLISYMWRFLHVLIISNYFCNFLSSVYSFHFPTKNKKVQLVLQEALKMRNEIGLFGFTILSSTILKCVISKRDLFDKITM